MQWNIVQLLPGCFLLFSLYIDTEPRVIVPFYPGQIAGIMIQ